MISIKKIMMVLFGLMFLVGSHLMSFKYGIDQGVDNYHQGCYNSRGVMVVDEEGHVVQCAPLVKIPREEAQKLREQPGVEATT